MKKINLITITAALLIVSIAPYTCLAYSGGNGTTGNPYQIANVADFQQLSTTSTDWSKSFILTANINLTSMTFTQAPIAPNLNAKFTGIFNGNGHIISKLTVTASTKDYVGLFGCVDSGAQINNLGLENVNITGRDYVGGVAGQNNGLIDTCHVSGSVTGGNCVGGVAGNHSGTITSCYATGSVSGTNDVGGLTGGFDGWATSCHAAVSVSGNTYIGGLIGYNYGDLNSCYATGSVSGTGDYVGGLVGNNSGTSTLTSCYATGSVSGKDFVGGLVGYNYYRILISCYASGSVIGTGNYVGGLAGASNTGTITVCYARGSVNGTYFVGGLVGSNSSTLAGCFWDTQTSSQANGTGNGSTGVAGKMTAEMKTLSTFTDAGWDFVGETTNGTADIWTIPIAGGYPILSWQIGGSTSTVNVPDVVGMAQANAQSAITSAGLIVGTVTTAYSDSVAAGNVINQSPNAGTTVNSSTAVNIQISLGVLATVPAIQVKKCVVTAGSKVNSDTISFSGVMNPTDGEILAASQIVVTVDSDDIVNPCIMTFPINAATYKKGSYNYTLKAGALQSTFKMSTKTGVFSFSAKNVDLTGLACPVTVTIQIGGYSAQVVLTEDIINGTKKLIPYQLMMSVQNMLVADKVSLKRGKKLNTDSLKVSGQFTTVGEPNLSNPMVITVGSQTLTVLGNKFLSKNGVDSCKAISNEGPLVTAKLDYVKCIFTISVKNASITQHGIGGFGINCFGVSLNGLETIDLGQ